MRWMRCVSSTPTPIFFVSYRLMRSGTRDRALSLVQVEVLAILTIGS